MQTPGPTGSCDAHDVPVASSLGLRQAVVLVGASVRAAAESAVAAGFRVIAIDRFGDRGTHAAAEHWISLEEFRSQGFGVAIGERTLRDLVAEGFRLSIVGGINTGYRWIDPQGATFLGAEPGLLEVSQRPEFLAAIAERARVGFPETFLASEVPDTLANEKDWFLKKLDSSGGFGVRRYDSAVSVNPDTYLQRRHCGRVVGATYLADGREATFVGASRLLQTRLGALPCVFCGAIGPVPLSPDVRQDLISLGNAFVVETGSCGPMNIDVIVGRTGRVTLLEVNPRWSASMELVERSWQERLDRTCSFFDPGPHWRSCIKREAIEGDPSRRAFPVYLKRIVFAESNRTLLPDAFKVSCPDSYVWKDVPVEPTRVNRHEPVATLIARLGTQSPGVTQLRRLFAKRV